MPMVPRGLPAAKASTRRHTGKGRKQMRRIAATIAILGISVLALVAGPVQGLTSAVGSHTVLVADSGTMTGH